MKLKTKLLLLLFVSENSLVKLLLFVSEIIVSEIKKTNVSYLRAYQCFSLGVVVGGGTLTGGIIQQIYPNPSELDRVP